MSLCFNGVYPPSPCQPAFKRRAQLEKCGTWRIMMRVGAARWMQMRFSVNPPLHCNAPRKVEGQMGSDFYLRFWKCSRSQNIFRCADEICLKQSRSCKAALGNTSISFSKLLFSHAGGKSLQVKCNHPAVGFALSGIIIILGWVPSIANIKLVI